MGGGRPSPAPRRRPPDVRRDELAQAAPRALSPEQLQRFPRANAASRHVTARSRCCASTPACECECVALDVDEIAVSAQRAAWWCAKARATRTARSRASGSCGPPPISSAARCTRSETSRRRCPSATTARSRPAGARPSTPPSHPPTRAAGWRRSSPTTGSPIRGRWRGIERDTDALVAHLRWPTEHAAHPHRRTRRRHRGFLPGWF
jgi:hypothetical protein